MEIRRIIFEKISLIVLFIIFSSNLFSQLSIYKPFPLLRGTWDVDFDYDVKVTSPNINVTQYSINGDTIIGSYTYKKINCANYTGPYTLFSYGPSVFCFAYRNDIPNKKVYIYKYIAGQYKDTLWYDFNLKIGDTLKKTTFSLDSCFCGMPQAVITSIDSTLICGVYHKTFVMSPDCSFGRLIEGIGFTTNFVSTSSSEMCYFEPTAMHTTYFSCTSVSVNELLTPSVNSLQLFPNPVINTMQINFTKFNIILPIEYSIVDCLGKISSKGVSTDGKDIDVSKLKNGLYFFSLQDQQKNIFQSKFLKQ